MAHFSYYYCIKRLCVPASSPSWFTVVGCAAMLLWSEVLSRGYVFALAECTTDDGLIRSWQIVSLEKVYIYTPCFGNAAVMRAGVNVFSNASPDTTGTLDLLTKTLSTF